MFKLVGFTCLIGAGIGLRLTAVTTRKAVEIADTVATVLLHKGDNPWQK